MAPSGLALTARGAGALFGALAVFALGFYSANVLVYAIGVFLLTLVLGELLQFVAATRGFGPEAFRAERIESSAFAPVGGAALVSVRVTSGLKGSYYAEVVDVRPEPLRLLEGESRLMTWWPAGESLSLAYVVSPRMRGLFEVGPTTVVAHDALGFGYKTAALADPWRVEAIPEPPSLPIARSLRTDSPVVGIRPRAVRGAGSDFRTLREYQSTDDPRRIAWTRSGKGVLLVREYDQDSQPDLVALVDVGRGMSVGLPYEDALERSVEAAALALRLSFDADGRSGLVLFADRVVTFVPTGRGTDHEFRVFRSLTAAAVGPRPGQLDEALLDLAPHLGRPTHLFAFSSLTAPPERLAAAAATVRRGGHHLVVFAPDPRGMYPVPDEATERTTLSLLYEEEARRVRDVASVLEGAGATVILFGRQGAVGAVSGLFMGGRGGGGAP